ncbi:MAG TPA: porin [Steroidobacteraceae bacterium]
MTLTSQSPSVRAKRTLRFAAASCACATLGLLSHVAQAQMLKGDDALTFKGIQLYGIVDIGLQYDSHAAPISDYYPAGSSDIVQKNSNHSIVGATPSNLSQSRVGLQGSEPIAADWSGVFKLETFFNPQSGEISDGPKSQVQNNGRPLASQTTNLDSSVAGQIFQQSFAGISSKTFGTLTFGRQNTLMADGISKYDPQAAAQAFSVIGLSGTAAGAGDTQDRRLDSSAKYLIAAAPFHVGLQYKFSNAYGGANTAFEAQAGGEFAGLSVDAYYIKVNSAIAVSALSAAQVATLPSLGYSSSNSLAGTISDNTTFSLMARYALSDFSLLGGYEHIKYADPNTPLPAGFDDIGGYKLAFVNNTAFPNDKILQVYWAGVKYTVAAALDLTVAYYGYRQNSYATGANAGCSSTVSGSCSGNLNAVSFAAVYRLTKRFDAYAGAMWSGVQDGLANGYLNKNNIDPTLGVRFKF